MKTGVLPKILSLALSLIFLGSGLLHPFIHSCGQGQCSRENESKTSSVTECRGKGAVPKMRYAHSEDSIHPVKIFCQICAGMFNFVYPSDSTRSIQKFAEAVFLPRPDSPVPVNDCRLPLTRAPPLSWFFFIPPTLSGRIFVFRRNKFRRVTITGGKS